MKKIIALLCLLFSFTTAHVVAQSASEIKIRTVLEKQRNDWNKGDLEAYMGGYWKSDSLMFIGKSGITYGWENTLNNYKKGYPDTSFMGHLDFDILKVIRLSKSAYYVIGKWHLNRSVGDYGGAFTLLFRKIKKQWLIVADHSS